MPVELPSVAPETLRELERIDHRHAVRLALFVAMYLASAAFTLWIVSMYGSGWATMALCLPLYVLSAASLHGISLFTHEGVHGGLSRSRFWNRALSMACALPVLQNFAAYRVLHIRHHHDTGGSRDPDHYENYSGRSWLLFLMHWGRLLVGYPAYITMIPILALRHGKKADRLWTLFESGLLILLVTGALLSPIPRAWLLHAWLLPMVIINTLVNIRGMSQHTLLDEPDHPIRGTRHHPRQPQGCLLHVQRELPPGAPPLSASSLVQPPAASCPTQASTGGRSSAFHSFLLLVREALRRAFFEVGWQAHPSRPLASDGVEEPVRAEEDVTVRDRGAGVEIGGVGRSEFLAEECFKRGEVQVPGSGTPPVLGRSCVRMNGCPNVCVP